MATKVLSKVRIANYICIKTAKITHASSSKKHKIPHCRNISKISQCRNISKYHTVETYPKYHTVETYPTYHTVETYSKSNV